MAELTALLFEIGTLPPGSHLHVVTDKHNLETNFPPDFEVQTPNTFYKITNLNNEHAKQMYNVLPTISPHTIKPSAITHMIILLVLSTTPDILNQSLDHLPHYESQKLLHGVNSGRNLIEYPRENFVYAVKVNALTYFKGPSAIFWLTKWIPRSSKEFPSHSFFTRQLDMLENPAVFATVFMVQVSGEGSDSEVTLICSHCSLYDGPTFIRIGYITNRAKGISWTFGGGKDTRGMLRRSDRLVEMVEILAPVKTIITKHSYQFDQYVSNGCQTQQKIIHPNSRGISQAGFFCGFNLTIVHSPFFERHLWTSLPLVFDETYGGGRYVKI